MEQKLMKEGMVPEEARIETRKKLYPSSLPKLKKDGTIDRSHNLLELRDSDSDEYLDLEKNTRELFDRDPFDDIETGDNVDPNDIYEEINNEYFCTSDAPPHHAPMRGQLRK